MSRPLPKKNNPLILADAAPPSNRHGRRLLILRFFSLAIIDEDLLARRRLGKTHLSVKPGQIGTSNATKPENLGLFEYAHLRAPLPRDLKGSEIFPSHTPAQHPETYFLMRRSKDGFVSATGMFKIAFPWAKAEEEKIEREYLKSREFTSQEEVAGNVWISPQFALELAREYKMYDWVRALLDPTDIVQSPTSAKKQITPPPKFELPMDEPGSQRSRSRRSVSPSKKSVSPRKSRQARSAKDVLSTPSTTAANDNLQKALDFTASMETSEKSPSSAKTEETEVKANGSPEKKTKSRKSKKAGAEAEEEKEEKQEDKDEKKLDKKKKKEAKKESEAEVTATSDVTEDTKTTTVSLDIPISLPEVPSVEETQEMIAKAKEMVEAAVKAQGAEDGSAGSSAAKATKKRKPVEEDDESSAEAAQRVKKAKVLEDKLKRERVRNRALFGVSAAFALAASIPYFF
ncbi:hypothetical protein N7462_004729 [Penicillium macrosclerotiorum]|uniref:uncharacterized protein n=1 Tax=Penicillium macrosclerotiorum TaxID=303699 RepID=UPI00254710BF|nr:uncharacterized protein N7462_004729 [Penicillium macrosclerotiorum]KAJ5690337.1 hypothetical protein N7462_004729 [Penicillium macrosclerotiorum]